MRMTAAAVIVSDYGSPVLLSRMSNGEAEVFASIQGEGVSAGVPSVFIRFAECNLVCGFCDTKYTWDWERHDRDQSVLDMPEDELVARVTTLAAPATMNVVITGGEPMLHQEDLGRLLPRLRALGMTIEIETNGTIEPTPELRGLIDQWNVSPKLVGSGNKASARLRQGPMSWFASEDKAKFKFVIVADEDIAEVVGLVRTYAIAPDRVLLMPEGTDEDALRRRSAMLAAACQHHGFRFGTRLHVLIWGAERGR